MANKQVFQFTLGPVQGFVAQARRTRDFWAGSFILSWLSSVAMASIQQQGGKISFPTPNQHYLDWLHGKGTSKPPLQGSVPNRFKAMTAEVTADFKPELVSDAVLKAWQALAERVWQEDLEGIASDASRAIWQRQTNSFWEISWVLSADEDTNLLDRRKNWRGQVAPSEPGHKCMMMDGWQELSGILVSNMSAVNRVWETLRETGKSGIRTDLREGEQLCAMAFIKRRFVRYFHQVHFQLPGSDQLIQGWRLPSAVPSVAFLAAAPWIAEVIRNAPLSAFNRFHDAAQKLTGYSEAAHVSEDNFAIDIQCVSDAVTQRKQKEDFNRLWAGLDGQTYFPSALQNENLFDDQTQAGKVLNALNSLRKEAGMEHLPSPFYAILLMDGDQLGSHMGDASKQQPISAALNAFTEGAGNLVREHNGFLVYAGGDDVLALLPLEDALPAAAALQAFYKHCFATKGKGIVSSTLSGAIEYVHIRTPLTRVLQNAHNLLDDVAKDASGRDSIAVRVWKPTGMVVQWNMPWAYALDENGTPLIGKLAEDLATLQGEEAHFSSKFFFRAKQVISRFPEMPDEALGKVLKAEYLHSFGSRARKVDAEKLAKLEESLACLLAQSRYWHRMLDDKGKPSFSASGLNPDAALLVRFLATKGMERDSL